MHPNKKEPVRQHEFSKKEHIQSDHIIAANMGGEYPSALWDISFETLFQPASSATPVDIRQRHGDLRALISEHHPGLITGPLPEDPATIDFQIEQMQGLLLDILEGAA